MYMLQAILQSDYFLICCQMLLATFFGALIGYDREKYGKPAGIKTHSMVCLGACIVMIIGTLTTKETGYSDPNRLAAQVVSGIGFLCGGVIIVTNRSEIKGLTTAAGLWLAACMGLCIGSSYTWMCFPAGICYFLITHVLSKIESKKFKANKNRKAINSHDLEHDDNDQILS